MGGVEAPRLCLDEVGDADFAVEGCRNGGHRTLNESLAVAAVGADIYMYIDFIAVHICGSSGTG